KEKLDDLRDSITDLARAACPHDTTELREQEEKLAEQVHVVNRQLMQMQESIASCEFWAKAFRDILLSLVDSALVQFELTTNAALVRLGLQDWSIEYGIEAETKGGKLHRGFKIFIRSPHNDNIVPFIAWSGGESPRLRL